MFSNGLSLSSRTKPMVRWLELVADGCNHHFLIMISMTCPQPCCQEMLYAPLTVIRFYEWINRGNVTCPSASVSGGICITRGV
jgi:hypothetical protein